MPNPAKVVEYWIYKMYRKPEQWDGPYDSLSKAKEDFAKTYSNDPTQPQDFAIFRQVTTTTRIAWPRKKQRRKS